MLTLTDNALRVMQLTDLHLGQTPFEASDLRTLANMRAAIAAETPDLIVLSGDLIWSDGVVNPAAGLRALVAALNEFDIPVATTYGNHDSEETLDRADLRELTAGLTHHVAKAHAFVSPRGKESYAIEIGESGRVSRVAYVFDTGNVAPAPQSGYDWVEPETIDWYVRTQAAYQAAGATQDVAFMHIPVPEYAQAAEHIVAGKWWEMHPRIAAPELNTGLFTRFLTLGNLSHVFCGHDHDNNFDGVYLGVHLVYGNVSGYNCYGVLPRGYRMITLAATGVTTEAVLYPEPNA
ncbi:metallophosphoesterase family protein [Lacticaseibacillus kribbianus]|uniref:metallophosphoesterase family protein n=1 Tax=Lacticaseibacillus kribbianus TaxID=2926292 RepID=UPI001CD2FB1F|nr:metallophosphoesterase family protein [Lacticaseibacillus kribbianus]